MRHRILNMHELMHVFTLVTPPPSPSAINWLVRRIHWPNPSGSGRSPSSRISSVNRDKRFLFSRWTIGLGWIPHVRFWPKGYLQSGDGLKSILLPHGIEYPRRGMSPRWWNRPMVWFRSIARTTSRVEGGLPWMSRWKRLLRNRPPLFATSFLHDIPRRTLVGHPPFFPHPPSLRSRLFPRTRPLGTRVHMRSGSDP